MPHNLHNSTCQYPKTRSPHSSTPPCPISLADCGVLSTSFCSISTPIVRVCRSQPIPYLSMAPPTPPYPSPRSRLPALSQPSFASAVALHTMPARASSPRLCHSSPCLEPPSQSTLLLKCTGALRFLSLKNAHTFYVLTFHDLPLHFHIMNPKPFNHVPSKCRWACLYRGSFSTLPQVSHFPLAFIPL